MGAGFILLAVGVRGNFKSEAGYAGNTLWNDTFGCRRVGDWLCWGAGPTWLVAQRGGEAVPGSGGHFNKNKVWNCWHTWKERAIQLLASFGTAPKSPMAGFLTQYISCPTAVLVNTAQASWVDGSGCCSSALDLSSLCVRAVEAFPRAHQSGTGVGYRGQGVVTI